MRFCGSCGARLTGAFPAAPITPARPQRASFYPSREASRPFVGREKELAQLLGLRDEANGKLVWAHVSGEPGVGKSRLLEEMAKASEDNGDVVVGAGPHPSRAPVPYAPLVPIVSGLLAIPPSDLAAFAKNEASIAEPIVRAGFAEIASPSGLSGYEDRGRTGAAALALATAIAMAAARAETNRVVIAVDDLQLCDGLTQQVLRELAALSGSTSVLLMTAGFGEKFEADVAQSVRLQGLDPITAEAFMSRHTTLTAEPVAVDARRLVLPLYLEQVEALGSSLTGDESLPPRLADAVAQRLDRLSLSSRRVLQAASVVGDVCPLNWIRRLVDAAELPGLEALANNGIVRVTTEAIEFTHPFIRDLVESAIPAEARRTLHERALQIASDDAAPLEVRAEHAYRAGEPMSALMLLERMGDKALTRGDARAAVLAFRRALELARREMLETGDFMLEGAIVTFSRKLGEALERSGDVAGADGVLREALDLAGPASAERARMLLALGRVAARRDRRRDAVRLLGQALELAERQREREIEARVHVGMARVRRMDGDLEGAASALRRAIEIEQELPETTLDARARTLLELSETLLALGDVEGAGERLTEARLYADQSGATALLAAAVGSLGIVDHHRGQRESAVKQYEDAARISAEAGDGPGHERWRAAALSMA
jgi:serine/threonine-protein kinase